MFFFYQPVEQGHWVLGLADQRAKIVHEKKPALTTVLDCDNTFESDLTAEQHANVRYRGPFYIDLDSKDIEQVIGQAKKLLEKLEDKYSINADQILLFATGGKGFHFVIRPEMFMAKVPPKGIQFLPLLYREMANEMFVDTLDLAIYSMKKGRMFREQNIKRSNGRYKVRVTPKELRSMTPEMYEELTSNPRYDVPEPDAPTYSGDLGLAYSKAQSKIDTAMRNRKSSKGDAKVLKSFGGKPPPTLLSVMSGEQLEPGVGFQKIATQLAIAAHALLMTQEKFLEACKGLIENHSGDGFRYNTPAKRASELSRMYAYMHDNPAYTFSVGGIKSLMTDEGKQKSTDLDLGAEVSESVSEEDHAADKDLGSTAQGVKVTEQGIYRRNEEGLLKVSDLGFANPRQMVDLASGEVKGYEVDVYVSGKKTQSRFLPMDTLVSRHQMVKFCLSYGSAGVSLSDTQVGAIADIMRVRSEKQGQVVYTIRREGIDVIATPDGQLDIVWADQYGVSSTLGKNYRVTGSMTDEIQFRTDLRKAPPLQNTPETLKFFENLFEINRVDAVGCLLGWYLACFLSQPIRHIFNQFPFLQVYGPAGSGKSATNKLLARMHYFKQRIHTVSALDITRFTFDEYSTCTASIPFIMDEFKPREMRRDIYEKSKGILRSNYNGDQIAKGTINSQGGMGKLTLTKVMNTAPMVVIGEGLLSQSALQERCVAVPITKDSKSGRYEAFDYCQEHQEVLSGLGRVCIDMARGVDLDALRKQVSGRVKDIRAAIGSRAEDSERQVFNAAVTLTGLEMGRVIMAEVFDNHFEPAFERMSKAVMDACLHGQVVVVAVQSEASKVLSEIAFLSHYDSEPRLSVKPTQDYVEMGDQIHIRLRNVFSKYRMYKKMMGEESLYDNYEAFQAAMHTYAGVVDHHCTGSPLKDSPSTAVFAFDRYYLQKDKVEDFR